MIIHISDKRIEIIKTVVNIVAGFLIILFAYNFSSIAYRICDDFAIKARLLDTALEAMAVVLCLYLYSKYVMHCRFRDLYIRKPVFIKKWFAAAVILPVSIDVFYMAFIPGELSHDMLAWKEATGILIGSVLSYGIMTGFVEEIIFRGLVMRSLENCFGRKIAVVVSSVLFAANHLDFIDVSEPRNIVWLMGSITLAGIALSLVTYQTGSIWSSFLIHAVYNILGGESNLFRITADNNFSAIFRYTVKSSNRLFTGIPGADNIDTALPAMAGFSIIIVISLLLMKNNRKRDEQDE